MSSLVFPLELWLNILPRACQDDGTAGLSLSSASQELRFISKPYRYQSVQIKGWRQLLLFEERFSRLSQDEQRIVNLFVDLENVFEVGYPGAPMWAPEDSDPDDASYVPSDDDEEELAYLDNVRGSEGVCREHGGSVEGGGVENVEPEGWDTEGELELTSPSISEQLELEDDSQFLRACRLSPPKSLFPGGPGENMTLEDLQQDVNHQSIQAEGFAYAALHRILEACSESLEVFTLCWNPANGFKGEEFFPVLPMLRSLTVWRTGRQSRPEPLPWSHGFNSSWRWGIHNEAALFPSLRRLELNRPFDGAWFQSMTLKLVYVSGACTVVGSIPNTVKQTRICCNCPPGECNRYPGSSDCIRVDSIDFRREWVDQVLRCSITPGFEPGNIPVMVIAWVKDTSRYHDAVLITDEMGCIRLWDHKHQLEPRGIHSKLRLELYDPSSDGWFPVSWWGILGPITYAGKAILLRAAGIQTIRHFDCFASMAYSISTVHRPSQRRGIAVS